MADTVLPPATVSVGQIVTFKGYSSLDAGVEPILVPGQLVRIDSINEIDGAMVAVPVDGGPGDTVFSEEIEFESTDATAAGELAAFNEAQLKVAAMSAKLPRKTEKVPAKGKGKVKAKTPAKVEVKAKVKPKAEVKAAAKAKAAAEKAAEKATKAEPIKAVKLAAVKAATKIKAKGRAPAAARQDDLLAGAETIEVESAEVKTGAVAPSLPVAFTSPMSSVTTEGGRVADSDRVALILSQQDALDAAKALVAQAEETYFTLGGVLSHIYYEGIHKTLGYDGKRGFEEYVEKELGVAYRKAMYLIDIYTKFRALNIDERRLTQIGWSKAKELTRFVTAENFDSLVEAATEKSREELIDFLRSSFTNAETGEQEQARRVKIGFALFADQAETVTRALDAAKDKVGNDNLNQALEYICAEWLSLSADIEIPLEDAVRHLEAKYGVRLVPQSASEGTDVSSGTVLQSAGH